MDETAVVKPQSKKSLLWKFLFIAANIAVVIIIATVDFGGETATVPLSDAFALFRQNRTYLIFALCLPIVFIGLDILKYTIMIHSATKRVRPMTAYNCSQLGRYYDNVTPFGAGGQAFQIHYLTTKKIDGGNAMAIVITTFILQQLAFTLAGPYFIIRYCMSSYAQTYFIVLAWVGYAIYLIIPLTLILITIKPSIAAAIANFFLRLLKKMRLLKQPERFEQRIKDSLDRYQQTAAYIAKNIFRVLIVTVISLVQFAVFFAIPYFVCRALGATAEATVDLFTRMVTIYFAITIVPTPGNSVAAEFSFLAVFASILQGYVFWGILLWRLLVFYLYLAQGLIILISRAFRDTRRARKERGAQPEPTPENEIAVSNEMIAENNTDKS